MANSFKKGKYVPVNKHKYVGDVDNIIYRSSWERTLMMKFDISDSVIKWSSEEQPIPYYDSVQKKMRRYFVDFYVLFRTDEGEVVQFAIEVKPYAQTIPPQKPKNNNPKRVQRYLKEATTYQNNCDKWKFAKEWCLKNNFKFLILHEKNVGGIF